MLLSHHLQSTLKRSRASLQTSLSIIQKLSQIGCLSKRHCRHFASSTHMQASVRACVLKSRAVLRLMGPDTTAFLQGLVTNDVQLLMEKSPQVQYCMMLNVQGRVLYDLFLYNIKQDESSPPDVLVDVDASVKEDLIRVFKKYKLRKKVDINDASSEFKVIADWGHSSQTSQKGDKSHSDAKETLSFHDPRVPIFANRGVSSSDHLKDEDATENKYRAHRYRWGIPEGVLDLPPGNCLPLESNLALMNGVSFQKGCYIGQELTARTFHTGVTRKRLMPVVLNGDCDIAQDTQITTEKGKNAGKLRSAQGGIGLGLLRLAHVKDKLSVIGQNGQTLSLTVEVPSWWPSSILGAS